MNFEDSLYWRIRLGIYESQNSKNEPQKFSWQSRLCPSYDRRLQSNLRYFVDCLPIVTIQFLLSLQFKNFMLPISTGFAIWFVGVALSSTSFSYCFPFLLCGLDFLASIGDARHSSTPVNLPVLAMFIFVAVTILSYVLLEYKNEKG